MILLKCTSIRKTLAIVPLYSVGGHCKPKVTSDHQFHCCTSFTLWFSEAPFLKLVLGHAVKGPVMTKMCSTHQFKFPHSYSLSPPQQEIKEYCICQKHASWNNNSYPMLKPMATTGSHVYKCDNSEADKKTAIGRLRNKSWTAHLSTWKSFKIPFMLQSKSLKTWMTPILPCPVTRGLGDIWSLIYQKCEFL